MPSKRKPAKTMLAAELRRRAFVDHYCGKARFNAAHAARLTGYRGNDKAMKERGREMLARDDVVAMIRERLIAAEVDKIADAREAMVILSQHLRGSMDDFTTFDEDGNVIIDMVKAKKEKKLGLVKKFHFKKRDEKDALGGVVATTYETKIELYDAQAAAEKILKARGIIGHDPIPLHSPQEVDVEARAMAYIEKWLALGNSPEGLTPKMYELYRTNMVKQIESSVH